MALELPEWLVMVFNLVGLPWPGVDEDELHAWARSVRQFADDIVDNSSHTNQTMRELAASSQSSVITAVAGEWEHHHQLLVDLHGPIHDFAEALDVAGDAVLVQKEAVITAFGVLAGEFTATQIGAFFTAGADEVAVVGEVLITREAVKKALETLAGALLQTLIQEGVMVIVDHLNRTIGNLLTTGLNLKMEADSLKIIYEDVISVAREIRGHANTAEDIGNRAHAENTSRDLEDNCPVGGGWSAVINALKDGLLDFAKDIFKSLPHTIGEVLRDIAKVLEDFASKLKGADEEGAPAVTGGGSRAAVPGEGATSRPEEPPGSARGNRDPAAASTEPGSSRANDECDGQGDPVDVATGDVMLSETDVTLPGVLPLVLGRSHRSSRQAGRWFGRSWMSSLDQRLIIADERIIGAFDDGRLLTWTLPGSPDDFPVIPEAGPTWTLRQDEDDAYTVNDPQAGLTWRFEGRAGYENELPLTSVTDRIGHEIAFNYDVEGRPLSVTHSGGYRILVTVADEHVTGLTLAGRDGEEDIPLRRFDYGTDGNLSGVVNSSGLPMRFTYDDAGRLTSWTDRNDYSYRYTYDDHGRCIRGDGPGGALSGTFTYEPGTTRWTTIDGAVTTYEITDSAEVAATIDPLGNTTRWEFDSRSRVITHIDPLSRITRYAYDDHGNLVAITRPDGSQATAGYDDHDRLVSMTRPDGAIWRQEFDEFGNPTSLIAPDSTITRYSYDDERHLASITNASGAVTRIVSNAAGIPLEVAGSEGGRERYERDQFGRITQITGPDGTEASLSWTNEGRLAQRLFVDGDSANWTYDGEGNLISHLNPAGLLTRYEYGPLDRLTSITNPNGTRTEFTYDNQLRVTSVLHGGLAWRYEYDAAGRATRETDYNGAVTAYSYDPAGQLVSSLNAVGQQVTSSYSQLGKLVEQVSDDIVTTFDYDAIGRLISAHNPDADLLIERDVLGRVVRETCNGRTVTSEYTQGGQLARRVTPSGAVTDWVYTPTGHAVAMTVSDHEILFDHDLAGRETRRDLPGGLTLVQDWDQRGRLALQTLTGAGSPRPKGSSVAEEVLQRRAYSYRADGLLRGIDDQLAGDRTIELDPAGRVTSITGQNWAEQYAYDLAGNVIAASWPAIPSAPGATRDGSEVQGQREFTGTLVKRAGHIRYRYDSQGRVIQRQRTRISRKPDTWHYQWDANNRLTSVDTPDGTRWHYLYDPLGRRITKRCVSPDGTVTGRTEFTWHGVVLAEQTSALGEVHQQEIITWNYKPGTFTAVSQSERTSSHDATQDEIDEHFYAIITDLIGTPTELTDSHGTLVGHQVQTLWGQTTWGSDGASTSLRFPGQYADHETCLHYNNQRYYDPATGSYLSPDPLGLAPAPNPHAYVPNPQICYDPLGLQGSGCGPIDLGDGTFLHPDGSIRYANGKYAGTTGEQPGTSAEETVWDHLATEGANVVRRETGARAPGFPLRKYDGLVELQDGWYGIEVKGSSASRTPEQRAFDNWLNTPGNTATTTDGKTLVGVFDAWVP